MDPSSQAAFTAPHRIGLLILSLALFLLVIELVRRRRFKERYALLWIGASAGGLAVGIFPGIIVWIARVTHVQFLTVFFATAFLFLLCLVLSFSMVISRLADENRVLAQDLALLEHRLKRLEDGHERPSGE
ncbi:MAG TPA: DUF2304 domain-containing protein [Candidatus Hydrogenedentes bacterium]|nr:DUF2304 domain-containing protein [Candidatus Hydrogenedentota bacterium]